MARRLIYMNEAIREAEPSKPVIVVQTGQRLKNTNLVRLTVAGVVVAEVRFVKEGLAAAPQHKVRAYIEVIGDVGVVCE